MMECSNNNTLIEENISRFKTNTHCVSMGTVSYDYIGKLRTI